jgi:hypothetical protein
MTHVPEKPSTPFLIDSCHNTWEFDPERNRYRRHIKSPGRFSPAASAWATYWGVIFDEDSESFVVLLNESGTRILRSYSHSPGCSACADQHTEQLDLSAIRRSSDVG